MLRVMKLDNDDTTYRSLLSIINNDTIKNGVIISASDYYSGGGGSQVYKAIDGNNGTGWVTIQ